MILQFFFLRKLKSTFTALVGFQMYLFQPCVRVRSRFICNAWSFGQLDRAPNSVSFFHFEGLPDEILLKIFSLFLTDLVTWHTMRGLIPPSPGRNRVKGVLQCDQVSNRLRDISNDQSLWLKLNLSEREVPFDSILLSLRLLILRSVSWEHFVSNFVINSVRW